MAAITGSTSPGAIAMRHMFYEIDSIGSRENLTGRRSSFPLSSCFSTRVAVIRSTKGR
jgi:hypothetical protein